jgi:RNase P subunit RPR2
MSHEPDRAYRCPKCGATAALLMPEVTRQPHVALKCLECAHIERVPRHLLQGAGGALDSNSPLD